MPDGDSPGPEGKSPVRQRQMRNTRHRQSLLQDNDNMKTSAFALPRQSAHG